MPQRSDCVDPSSRSIASSSECSSPPTAMTRRSTSTTALTISPKLALASRSSSARVIRSRTRRSDDGVIAQFTAAPAERRAGGPCAPFHIPRSISPLAPYPASRIPLLHSASGRNPAFRIHLISPISLRLKSIDRPGTCRLVRRPDPAYGMSGVPRAAPHVLNRNDRPKETIVMTKRVVCALALSALLLGGPSLAFAQGG